ncbi:lamin tail domain-containing protein [Streptomyces tsukubensis]|uniref:LTD domain-containing protein n=1 Tax=Streptomyces tsukubensis TaxID=83656 RepID=A0A1V4AG49_9ACTN|nr:lamin tail domain-containing protein [Streptomyces tsukubensis]OON82862.1 hypothetical protein B1H18_02215 [Streptomyces tsukubensis]QFR91960.1 lamin tail domain-containing protein [Streptomyces tsukubensis]
MSRSVSRIAAALLASGAVVAMAFPASAGESVAQPHRSPVVLGDIQYNSPGPDTRSQRSLNGEWVTVTNNSRRPVNLRGWTLTNSHHQSYRFHSLRLGAHKSVKVHTGSGIDNRRHVHEGRRDHIWGNRHDTATLRDARGQRADTESWGGHHRR